MQKAPDSYCYRRLFSDSESAILSRGGGIRTHDPLTPSQVRYRTAPRPEQGVQCLNLGRFGTFEGYVADEASTSEPRVVAQL